MTLRSCRRAAVIPAMLLLLLTLLPAMSARGEERTSVTASPAPRLRALLIGGDRFLSMPDTAPGALGNLTLLEKTLRTDNRGYEHVTAVYEELASPEALSAALAEAFTGAEEDDLSLIYISTHGVTDPEGGFSLLLSDGEEECAIAGDTLRELVGTLPGQKLLILDCCSGGGLIGKGRDAVPETPVRSLPGLSVLCSAGAKENSLYWANTLPGGQHAGSFFCNALCAALGSSGGWPADGNADGTVTLKELYARLRESCGSSAVRVSPEEGDDRPIFVYAPEQRHPVRVIDGLYFEDTVLTPEENSVSFSYTVRRETQLFYQAVPWREGAWRFEEAQYLSDSNGDDPLSPGTYPRVLRFDWEDPSQSGYILLQLYTVESGIPVPQESRVLCMQGSDPSLTLSVRADPFFCPAEGEELTVRVEHSLPCTLTVRLEREDGSVLRYLCCDMPSRPESLAPEGSVLYWNGRLNNGETAPSGALRVRVTAVCGETELTACSEWFELKDPPSGY